MVTSEGHFITGVNLDDTNFSNGKTYDKWLGYGQSKTANIYMANYINRHYASQNLVGLSVHPGVILTECGRHSTFRASIVSHKDVNL
jgi:NAD(P)-dependent dehydrogenase (short-subunit alcohol dehydrogenase family)